MSPAAAVIDVKSGRLRKVGDQCVIACTRETCADFSRRRLRKVLARLVVCTLPAVPGRLAASSDLKARGLHVACIISPC